MSPKLNFKAFNWTVSNILQMRRIGVVVSVKCLYFFISKHLQVHQWQIHFEIHCWTKFTKASVTLSQSTCQIMSWCVRIQCEWMDVGWVLYTYKCFFFINFFAFSLLLPSVIVLCWRVNACFNFTRRYILRGIHNNSNTHMHRFSSYNHCEFCVPYFFVRCISIYT